jgi:hypothetical protein
MDEFAAIGAERAVSATVLACSVAEWLLFRECTVSDGSPGEHNCDGSASLSVVNETTLSLLRVFSVYYATAMPPVDPPLYQAAPSPSAPHCMRGRDR